jgi:hypothetical protein
MLSKAGDRGVVVSSAEEFQEYADECLGWAKTARTGKERDIFLQMAKAWRDAVLLAQERQRRELASDDTNTLATAK